MPALRHKAHLALASENVNLHRVRGPSPHVPGAAQPLLLPNCRSSLIQMCPAWRRRH